MTEQTPEEEMRQWVREMFARSADDAGRGIFGPKTPTTKETP